MTIGGNAGYLLHAPTPHNDTPRGYCDVVSTWCISLSNDRIRSAVKRRYEVKAARSDLEHLNSKGLGDTMGFTGRADRNMTSVETGCGILAMNRISHVATSNECGSHVAAC